MKNDYLVICLLAVTLSACSSGNNPDGKTNNKPNVLLIAVDDLRPELNCFGADHIVSPNIDELASNGVLFTNAYTQQAVCAPSRNTLMTGIRPDGLGIHDLATFFRTKAPDIQTLSQYFIQNGYHAEGMGKIYHTGHGNQNDTLSWSLPHWTPNRIINQRKPLQSGDTLKMESCYPTLNGKKIAWLNSAMPEEMHNDAMMASRAVERMEALKDSTFFLAVGFVKPHLPFVAPQKYWEMYDPQSIKIPSQDKPNDIPPYTLSNWGELRKYHNMPESGFLPDDDARSLIHGYYACVSFIDAQIGLLLEELKRLHLYDNTIIVLWGDHGWKLGEYGEWCKHTNYEIDTRIPVIVKTQGETGNGGWKSDAIIETVDIYPTLCDLAGLEKPGHLQGTSFKPALTEKDFKWDEVAFSQFPRNYTDEQGKHSIMGVSMRTNEYRLTRWTNRETGELVATELYDHSGSRLEMNNRAYEEMDPEVPIELNIIFDREYSKEHE